MVMKKYILLILSMFLLASCELPTSNEEIKNEDANNNSTNITLTPEEQMKLDYHNAPLKEGDLVAVMKTNNGTIKIKLFSEDAPKTVFNFVALSKNGYYKDVIFHRVIKDFMIQWGDPDGTGMGGESVYWGNFEDEFSENVSNIRGSISMANAGPWTNGSQFFINQKDNTFLDGKHSVFGHVIDGLNNVDKIAKTKTQNDRPVKDIKIISIEIEEYSGAKLVPYSVDIDAKLKEMEEAKKAQEEAKKSREIKAWDKIQVHYTGTLENGEKFDSSLDRGQPLEFEVGAGQMIKGFDAGVVGMKIGESKKLTLKPEDAYGSYREDLIVEHKLEELTAAWIDPVAWETVPTMYGEKVIVEVSEDKVKIDYNHNLVDKTLNFEVEIVDILN